MTAAPRYNFSMNPPDLPAIRLEGVRVHNLKGISLVLPLHSLIAVTGVSGSGKSSLAFDTLYAEGQRRYIESFSAYARQFLDRLEKPDADRIENLPPAIALKQNFAGSGGKSTIATTTEIHDYLRLLYAKLGRILCPQCDVEVRRDTPETAAATVHGFAEGTRFQVCFPLPACESPKDAAAAVANLKDSGFTRVIAGGRTVDLADSSGDLSSSLQGELWVVVDRLAAGKSTPERIGDSLELAFAEGEEQCIVLEEAEPASNAGSIATIDNRTWRVHRYSGNLICNSCGHQFVEPEPRLFSFNTPLGACPECRGFGAVPTISFTHVVPDPSKSLREGAIVPWTVPAYRHELDELLNLADAYEIPVDIPFSDLEPQHLALIENGVPERRFGGLRGFYHWLERHRYKMSVSVFLNRWRAYGTCPSCRGDRLQPAALAVRIAGLNIADLCRQTIGEALRCIELLPAGLSEAERTVSSTVLAEVAARLGYLNAVGLEYLTLDRPMRTLSGGEAQRVRLTSLLGSSLVNTLYVLDEPTAGMHPRDGERIIQAVRRLRDRPNTVLVVEHDEAFINAADLVVDIGPGAGREGGQLVFHGTPRALAGSDNSLTGKYLSGRAKIAVPSAAARRECRWGWLELTGARGHNLKNVAARFPLGVLAVVTGVSGSGKSTLVEQTLYPALCRALKQPCGTTAAAPFDRLEGAELLGQVVLVDQSPVRRSSRSNPVTYVKAFDEIRRLFAATNEARLRNLTAAAFSYNAAAGGRCPRCAGRGSLEIQMQFLADVSITCPECNGTRFKREILEIKYRGFNIDEVLNLTVREAFAFFRGQRKLQRSLSHLKDVGLDYMPLGQPAATLSGGEAQRLKIAAHLAESFKTRTLFLIDEPTTGLHPADVAKLLDCFAKLLMVGHSLVVVEHNLDIIKSADWVIDLGPEAADQGGQVVATGTPEQIAAAAHSITGRSLRTAGVLK